VKQDHASCIPGLVVQIDAPHVRLPRLHAGRSASSSEFTFSNDRGT
jgi:hypothetical protein